MTANNPLSEIKPTKSKSVYVETMSDLKSESNDDSQDTCFSKLNQILESKPAVLKTQSSTVSSLSQTSILAIEATNTRKRLAYCIPLCEEVLLSAALRNMISKRSRTGSEFTSWLSSGLV